LGVGKSQPTAQAINQCSLDSCRNPDFPLLHASLFTDAFSDASCNKQYTPHGVFQLQGTFIHSLSHDGITFRVSRLGLFLLLLLLQYYYHYYFIDRSRSPVHVLSALPGRTRSHFTARVGIAAMAHLSGGSFSQPQPEPCSMRPRNLKKNAPHFQPIPLQGADPRSPSAGNWLPRRDCGWNKSRHRHTRPLLGWIDQEETRFLEIDATACRRSLGITAPTRKKLRRPEWLQVEKRVLGCVLGVLGVLGVLASSCWSRGRRAMLTPQMPPHWQPLAPGQPTGQWAQGRTEGSSSPKLPQ
jgi:hypothetical protein